MRKSTKVTLTVVAAMGMAGCSRHRDPCDAPSFDAVACGDAIRSGGYYYGGHWYGMAYHFPYPYYYDAYRTHVTRGGAVVTAPAGTYARPTSDSGKRFGTGSSSGGTTSGSGVSRGGFGSTGAGNSSGS